MEKQEGTLYLIPTPIGNLADITLRSLELLKSVKQLLAEDTRQTKKLLDHYGIKVPISSFHAHNEHKRLDSAIEMIKREGSVGLVSDAGSPGISDPGFLLVREAIRQGINVCALPGPTAFVPALIASGIPCDRFVFEGFLPHKKGRSSAIQNLSENAYTTVIYESPHRINKLVDKLFEACGGHRQVCIAREISKIHEEYFRGDLEQAKEFVSSKQLKGEIVVIVAGK